MTAIIESLCPDGSSVNSDDDTTTLVNNYFTSIFNCQDTITILSTDPPSALPTTGSIKTHSRVARLRSTKWTPKQKCDHYTVSHLRDGMVSWFSNI